MRIRLKSLELLGFKTFASRSLFEFPAPITAIVGPNGSGKSNIADSARWVLGEQAYSLLRARKTEDMIFSGSEQKPKSGMALATITFDNADGWLPIDYEEVSVTRRAYRDGQNDYLINGQRVRLKEINELLSSSGLAERTYTIIGQGLVDSALSIKPDERRRFFEEAAGIGLFRTRRDEAINRLDVTRRNLERVEDILSELTPRLHSLERQAKKAREYHQVLDDLNVLLKDWYGYHWHRIQQEVKNQRAVVKAQETRLEQAKSQASKMEGVIGALRGGLSQVRQELNLFHAESAKYHSELEQTNRDLAVFDERKNSILIQIKNSEAEQTRLEEEIQELLSKNEGLENELAALQNEAQQSKENLTAEQAKYDALQKARLERENQIRALRKQMLDHEARKAQKVVQIQEYKEQISRNTQQLQSFETKLAAVQPQIDQVQASQKELAQRLEVINKNQAGKDEEYKAIQAKVNELEKSLKGKQEEKNQLDLSISKLKTQREVTEQAEKSLTGWGAGAKSLLASRKQGKLKQSLTPLVSQLQYSADLEKAVSAALSEYLEGLIIDTPEELEQTLAFIEKDKNNRVILLQADGKSDLKEPYQLQGEGVLGNLVDLIRYPEHLKKLIQAIGAQTFIVKDRQHAYRLLASLPADVKLVTLNGEMFTGKHAVIAGEISNQSVLARPRIIKEICDLIVEKESLRGKIQQEIEGLTRSQDDERNNLASFNGQLQELRRQRETLQRSFQDGTLQISKLQQQLEFLQSQISQTTTNLESVESRKSVLEESGQDDAKLDSSLQEELTSLQTGIDTHTIDELATQVNFWKTSLAVAEKSYQETLKRKTEFTARRNESEKRLNLSKQTSEKLVGDQSQLEAMRAERQQRSGVANQALADLQLKLQPLEQSLTEKEKEYDQQLSSQVVAQQALSVAERYYSQAQIELSRKNEELESIKRKVEDDFGLVAFPYSKEIAGPTPLPLGEIVEQLPQIEQLKPELEDSINRQRAIMKRMGAINLEAQTEYEEVKTRHGFLSGQVADLKQADTDLRKVISELEELMQREFRKTFEEVASEFKGLFTRLFGGGSAKLVLIPGEKPAEEGIDIEARLPGKREQGLALLSGGERSLTAVALVFALLKVSPTPFCILDEVDAALDESNVGRFGELLQELSEQTQFIIITHNRSTVQIADVIYGVTMGRDSSSQVISLKVDQLTEEMVR